MAFVEYLGQQLAPRAPFTDEVTGFVDRSKYYEVFVATWTLSASVLLTYFVEYLAGRHLLRLPSLMDSLQLIVFVVPFQICVLDYPVEEYSRFVLLFNTACCVLCAMCYLHRVLFPGRRRSASPKHPQLHLLTNGTSEHPFSNPDDRPVNVYLAGFRAIVYISTAVCIFARDQPCWNNSFSKSHSFGTGLMDIGLGCFIVCVGSLGPTATRSWAEVNRPVAMKKALVQFLVLSALGLVKTASVVVIQARRGDAAAFDDAWTEYGVHWNAFYSLAVAKLAGTALELHLLPGRAPPLLAALVAGLLHEGLLAPGGLALYALAPGKTEPHNRASLLGANREGLCSAPGLAALYLVGLQLGRWTHAWRGWHLACRMAALLAGCLAYRALLVHLPGLLLPESRRLLNLGYAAWIAAFAAFCLLNACCVVQVRRALFGSESCPLPVHLRRVDAVGLLYFLVSNLLTGLANLLVDRAYPNREDTDGWRCFVIVLAYGLSVYPLARLAQRLIDVRALVGRATSCCVKP